MWKQKKVTTERNSLMEYVTILVEKDNWVKISKKKKLDNNKKNVKAEKAVDRDEDNMVLCSLTMEIKK